MLLIPEVRKETLLMAIHRQKGCYKNTTEGHANKLDNLEKRRVYKKMQNEMD